MKNLRSLQRAAAIAAVTLLLQLCGSANAGNAGQFTSAMNETRKSTAVQTGVKLEIKRQSEFISTEKMSVIQSALAPKIGEVDSIIAKGSIYLTRLSGKETLSKKWSRSEEFKLKFSVDRYWADQFINEFRKNWIDAERRRTPSFADLYER